MRLPWRRKRGKEMTGSDLNTEECHSEAQHALARAIEAKHQAEAKWLKVADVAARVEHQRHKNNFGVDIAKAMRRRRST